MNPPAAPPSDVTSNRAAFLGFALLFAGLAAIGGWLLFANLPSYDDEGYILISVREYWRHGGLYNAVYSQYGPAFYVFTDALQRVLGRPLDHTAARLLTLALWLFTATASGAIVHRHTRTSWLTAFAAAGTFLYLYFIPDEPFHPGTLIIGLLAGSLAAIDALLARGRAATAAAVAGTTAAFLVLSKINVGIFYVAAVGSWFALHQSSVRLRLIAQRFLPIPLSLLAAALMRPLWGQPWVQTYLIVFACAAAALLLASRPTSLIAPRAIATFLTATALVGLGIVGAVLARGTTIAGLLEGLLWEPMRHAASYSYPVDWRPGTLLVALLSLFLAGADRWLRRNGKIDTADKIIVALRLVLGAATLVAFMLLMHARVIGAVFSYVAPLIWIWAVPLGDAEQKPETAALRSLLALTLLLQFLHGYPIGGIQESWGTFLYFPLVALGLGDVGAWIRRSVPATPLARHGWQIVAVVVVGAIMAKIGWVSIRSQRIFENRRSLDLPGAESMRLPEPQRTAYRILCLNASVHADMLFSLPGMFSFNLWTGLPPPTKRNTTVWFTLLDHADQHSIMASLDQAPRACVIVDETLLVLMRESKIPIGGPLYDYLARNFTPVFKLDSFVFHARHGHTLAPLHIAELASDPARPRTHRLMFRFVSDGAPIAAIEAAALESAASGRAVLDASNARVTVTPIDRSGQTRGASSETTWPIRVNGLAVVSLEFDVVTTPLPSDARIFYLRRADGSLVGEVRLPN